MANGLEWTGLDSVETTEIEFDWNGMDEVEHEKLRTMAYKRRVSFGIS